MYEVNSLLLLTGKDVPFRTARCSIHQPSINDISYIGEEEFQYGIRFLLFDKNQIAADKNDLEDQSNFNIFMSVMNSKEYAKHKTGTQLVLTLMFPKAQVKIEKDKILLHFQNFDTYINEHNFADLQDIVRQIFCMDNLQGQNQYNPEDDMARKIAEKIQKGQAKRNKNKEGEKVEIFHRYTSDLAIGLQMSINEITQYTVYQLMNQMDKFRQKEEFDMYLKAKMAGAKDIEEVKYWM